jgi:hypothetical protein
MPKHTVMPFAPPVTLGQPPQWEIGMEADTAYYGYIYWLQGGSRWTLLADPVSQLPALMAHRQGWIGVSQNPTAPDPDTIWVPCGQIRYIQRRGQWREGGANDGNGE